MQSSPLTNLANAQTFDEVCQIALTAATVYCGADGATLVLREGDLCNYYDERAIGPLWKGKRFPVDACISGWVMKTGETAHIPDIYQDDRIPKEAYKPTFVKSLCMVPIGKPVATAALGAYWKAEHGYNTDQCSLLSALAEAIDRAIKRVTAQQQSI